MNIVEVRCFDLKYRASQKKKQCNNSFGRLTSKQVRFQNNKWNQSISFVHNISIYIYIMMYPCAFSLYVTVTRFSGETPTCWVAKYLRINELIQTEETFRMTVLLGNMLSDICFFFQIFAHSPLLHTVTHYLQLISLRVYIQFTHSDPQCIPTFG